MKIKEYLMANRDEKRNVQKEIDNLENKKKLIKENYLKLENWAKNDRNIRARIQASDYMDEIQLILGFNEGRVIKDVFWCNPKDALELADFIYEYLQEK